MPDDISALHLVLTADPALVAIVRLSLIVSLSAVLCAAFIGIPVGATLGLGFGFDPAKCAIRLWRVVGGIALLGLLNLVGRLLRFIWSG